MIVLRLLGILLCAVLLIGIGLTVFTLHAKARIELKRKAPDGQLKLRISFGPVKRVAALTGRRKKKTQAQKKKQRPAKKPKQTVSKKTRPPMVDLRRVDIRQTMHVLLLVLDDLAGAMTWERLYVSVILHTPDAAETGTLLGTISAAVGNIYPYLERAFVLEDTRIIIDADFDADKTVWEVDISLMTQIKRFIRMGWHRRKEFWELWQSIRLTKEERKAWSAEQDAPMDSL